MQRCSRDSKQIDETRAAADFAATDINTVTLAQLPSYGCSSGPIGYGVTHRSKQVLRRHLAVRLVLMCTGLCHKLLFNRRLATCSFGRASSLRGRRDYKKQNNPPSRSPLPTFCLSTIRPLHPLPTLLPLRSSLPPPLSLLTLSPLAPSPTTLPSSLPAPS